MFPVSQGSAETLTRHSGGFKRKASSASDQEGLHFYVLVPTSTGLLRKPVGVSGGGEERQTYVMQQSVLINMIAILTTSVQKQFLFIN